MRAALDFLYRASGALAAFFLVAICAIVLVQVGFNIVDRVSRATTGAALGLTVPSYAEFTGFFLAASTFLAAAYTLKAGGHIRVVLITNRLNPAVRRVVEIWCAGFGAVFLIYFSHAAILLVIESWRFGDVSPGIVPVPIWLPQSAMALGLVVLTIALIDEFVGALLGRALAADPHDPTNIEQA